MSTTIRKVKLNEKQYSDFMLLFEKTLLAFDVVNGGKHVRNFINYEFVAHKLLSSMSIMSEEMQQPENVTGKLAQIWEGICKVDPELGENTRPRKIIAPARAALLIQQACRPWLDSFMTRDQQLGIRARISLKRLLHSLESQ